MAEMSIFEGLFSGLILSWLQSENENKCILSFPPSLKIATFLTGYRAHSLLPISETPAATQMPEYMKHSLFNGDMHWTCHQGNRLTAVMTTWTGCMFLEKNLNLFLHCYKLKLTERNCIDQETSLLPKTDWGYLQAVKEREEKEETNVLDNDGSSLRMIFR